MSVDKHVYCPSPVDAKRFCTSCSLVFVDKHVHSPVLYMQRVIAHGYAYKRGLVEQTGCIPTGLSWSTHAGCMQTGFSK